VLQKFVSSYNKTIHTTLGIAPANIGVENEDVIRQKWKKIREGGVVKVTKPKFKVGDAVRLDIVKGTFEKGYTERWSYEIHFVHKVYAKFKPYMYKIENENGTVLKGRFYEQQLQKVKGNRGEIEYRVDKILKTRKRKGKTEYLVKWENYPISESTWEPAENIDK
jgi:hypothetical protein